MAEAAQKPEARARGARMLRTALGPDIAGFLEDPMTVEVMLNPDGRPWIDRLSEGLSDTGATLSFADGERNVRLVAHHIGAELQIAPVGRPDPGRNRGISCARAGCAHGKTALRSGPAIKRAGIRRDIRRQCCGPEGPLSNRPARCVISGLRAVRP
ncbi:hypothetical protein EV662_109148 [Rhodovulum marinum]|uniref:Uncharacterized protein n=1 Tax=Rhodovulum marinum TaxID=320662 RepID=A0A4R2PVC5_9RHOB|nr:hypothetical protein EV662_109148 [Rhodovulum marinum]